MRGFYEVAGTAGVDVKNNLIYHANKFTGGGWSGEYIVYKYNTPVPVPNMTKFIYSDDEMIGTGEFHCRASKLGTNPRGKQWQTARLSTKIKGCILPFKQLQTMSKKKLKNIKCPVV